ncbi:MAG TPA: aminopeptidase N, partial [Nannocystis sp.]
IWVEPDNIDRCEHALRSLQRAMRWDEVTFGREYDLDVYMIVAVGDFNMGAMENKGLNIFNAKYVLARPDTATDDDYEAIEAVIAHEYFHNWTGNRITCRDWFQLTLKEGLTVFRDRLFSADMGSPAVVRIGDVLHLRTAQFPEDRGPMAHPIRPESYVEVNNFYTTTVYEKGAEVVRMYRTLLGPDGFRRGMDLYFERHDGQAVTCDDFRAAMADANAVDLEQFGRWYSQVGTPIVRARGRYDESTRSYTLTLEQAPPHGRDDAELLHIPVAVGLVGPEGGLPLQLAEETAPGPDTRVLQLRERSQTFRFVGVDVPPVPSLLRNFSAPVELEVERDDDQLALLMARDPDPFSRWDAGQELGRRVLLRLAADAAAGRPLALDPRLVDACAKILADERLDGSIKALMLTLPSEQILGQHQDIVDVDAVHAAHQFAVRTLAAALREPLLAAFRATAPRGPYSIERAEIDRRRLHNLCLAYLVALGEPELVALAAAQFDTADNMTDSQAALACLIDHGGPTRDSALTRFYDRWRGDPLVIDKWFTLQAISSHDDTLDRVLGLAAHPEFNLLNPNRARALLASFGLRNQYHFHRPCGRGYALLADKVLELDPHNPQVAARLVSAFNPWRRFDAARQAKMRAQLERIASKPDLSKSVREIVDRALAPA